MSTTLYAQLLYLIGGGLLLSSVLVLWRRELSAIVRLLVVQGILLACLAALLAAQRDSFELLVVAVGVLALKAVVVPGVLRRVLRDSGEARETEPLINVAASILAAVLLTLLAYAVSRPLVRLAPSCGDLEKLRCNILTLVGAVLSLLPQQTKSMTPVTGRSA